MTKGRVHGHRRRNLEERHAAPGGHDLRNVDGLATAESDHGLAGGKPGDQILELVTIKRVHEVHIGAVFKRRAE